METKKLNLGSGRQKKEGYLNVDIQDWDGNTDIKCDLSSFPYPFEDDSITAIYASEFLEHIGIKEAKKFVSECWRILDYDGSLTIQVPDAGKAMEYYVNKEICSCIKHKPNNKSDAQADPNCIECEGRAKINPTRWLYTFTGAQKHGEYDFHRNIFTKESLQILLEDAFFTDIEFKEHPFKLIVNCKK